MSLWRMVTSLFRPAKELVEVFKPNAEQEAQRRHEERLTVSQQDLASLGQFAEEFRSRRPSTAWDSFIDGLNRLPRPLITLGILGLFVLAPIDPVRFLEIARAYQIMPDGFWALLSIIIAFYFGGRMQLTREQMKITGGALAAAKDIVKVRRAFRDLAAEDEPPAEQVYRKAVGETGQARPANRVIEAWHRKGRPRA